MSHSPDLDDVMALMSSPFMALCLQFLHILQCWEELLS